MNPELNVQESPVITQESSENPATFQTQESTPSVILNPTVQTAISDAVKEEIKNEISTDKSSLFTVFGIFASLVTFVSVEIQVLKNICSIWNVLGFSLVIIASLLLFILVLDYIWRGWRNDFKEELHRFPWILLVIIVVIFTGSIVAMNFGNEQSCKENTIFNKYQSDFMDKQNELDKTLKQRQNDFEKMMQSKLDDFEKKIWKTGN